MLRIGRVNSRALHGPIRLPVDKKELMQIVEQTYRTWFNIFKETVVPRLINQPKWFKKNIDLKEEDVVYFKKEQNELASDWKIGVVDQLIKSRDGLIRRVLIRYYNASENDPSTGRYNPRITDRSIRGVVKLWSMDEVSLMEDLSELSRRLNVDYSHSFSTNIVREDTLANIAVFQCGEFMDLDFTLPCQVTHVERSIVSNVVESLEDGDQVDHTSLCSIMNAIGFSLE